jgi:hypothetical protein
MGTQRQSGWPFWRSRRTFAFYPIELSGPLVASAIAAILSLLVTEYLLEIGIKNPGHIAAFSNGRSWDDRSPIEVWRDERQRDPTVSINISPWLTMATDGSGGLQPTLSARGLPLLPLGGQSTRRTVYCNETGEYAYYNSDRHGFRNPRGIWEGPVDVAIVGDSYGNGACVNDQYSYISQIREKFPQTLNLSGSGNGALMMLAYMREYVRYVSPKFVIWLFDEGNDLDDLNNELMSPFMRSYLADHTFSQGLINRQPEIDIALQQFSEAQLALYYQKAQDSTLPFGKKLAQTIRLPKVRDTLHIPPFYGAKAPTPASTNQRAYREFSNILRAVNAEVKEKNAKLIFIYLPSWMRGRTPDYVEPRLKQISQFIKGVVTDQGINFLDLTPILASSENPKNLVWYPGSHFNHRGYRIVGQAIAEHLRALGK